MFYMKKITRIVFVGVVFVVLISFQNVMTQNYNIEELSQESPFTVNAPIGKVTIEFENAPLIESVNTVAERFSLNLWHTNKLENANKYFTGTLNNVSFEQALSILLDDTDLSYLVTDNGNLIVTTSERISQETGTIEGIVFDPQTGERLLGANVIIRGTTIGAATNMEGEFRLERVPPGNYTVIASYIGYRTMHQDVTVDPGAVVTIEFALEPSALNLEDIIVTGTAGDARRRAIGNAVSRLDVSELNEVTSRINITEVLQATTPGLTIMPGSGTAGTSANFRLRGAGSINARNQPVIFIDGIRLHSGSLGHFNVFGQNTTGLEAINPSDIESIEVIKGPAASTLYGAEAAAGVIQIITNRGRMGDRNIRWNFRAETGQSDWPERWRPTNYAICTEDQINNPDVFPGCQGVSPGEIISHVPLSEPNALRSGKIQRYNISASGGGQDYSFYVSFGHNEEEGVFYPNFSRRTSIRVNYHTFAMDKLDFSINMGYTNNHIRLPLGDNTADGIIISSWLATPGRLYSPEPRGLNYLTIAPEFFNTYDNQTRSDRFVIGSTINYRPFTWLDQRLRVGYDVNSGRATVYFPPDNPFANRTSFGLDNTKGLIADGRPLNSELTIDYAGTIRYEVSNNLSSNFSFGMQYYITDFSRTDGFGIDLGAAGLRSIDAAAVTSSSESFSEQKSLGFYIQEQVGWKDRLFITAALRMDNNSAFGSEISSVFYPKFSASYVITEEEFFRIPYVNDLRLRLAWGQAGNSPGPFDAIRTYGTTAYTLPDGSSASALQYGAFGNPDLKPERGTELEIGFDASLYRDRVSIEATYYDNRTKDALINIPVAPSTGFSGSQFVNLGEISNKGIELLLNVTSVQSSNLRIDHTVSFLTNNNKLVSFGEARDAITFGVYAPVHQFQEGKPLGAFWADRVQRDANGRPVFDEDGRPVLEPQKVYKGPSVPPRELAFSTGITLFQSVRIFAILDYKGGHYQFNVKDWRRDRSGVSWETVNPEADPDEVAVRRFPFQTDIHVQQADFVKLRDLSLSYILPSSWIQSFGIQRASVTISGHNLAIWTKYGGADPEVNFHGDSTFDRNDSWTLPMTRRVTGAINIDF